MKKAKGPKAEPSHLRRLRLDAEKQSEGAPGTAKEMVRRVPDAIIHELEVHQIELEMQNEDLKQARAALEESRDRYQDLYDFAPIAYFSFNRVGWIVEANLTGATLLGVPRGKLMGQGFERFVSPRSSDQWEQHLIAVLCSEERQVCELELRRKDGSTLHVQLDSVRLDHTGMEEPPVKGRDKIPAVRSAMSDITRRKEAERELERYRANLEQLVRDRTVALRESEEFKQVILNSLAAHIAVVDREGRILEVNEPWIRFARDNSSRGSCPLVAGVNYLDVCRRAADAHDPLAHEALEGIRGVLDGTCGQFSMEYPCPSPTEERWFQMTVTPTGDTGGAAVAHVDITARKQAEAALAGALAGAENERLRLEAVMEALPVGMALTDSVGGNVQSNSTYEHIWAGPRPAVKSVEDYAAYRAWWADTGKPVEPEEWASARAAREGRPVVGQIFEIERFDGSRAFVINSAAPVRDADGNVTGSAVAIQDITELRKAQQALRLSEEHFRSMAEALPQIVWTADSAGGVDWFNRRWYEYTGLPEGIGEGWSWDQSLHPDDLPGTLIGWQDALCRGALFQNEIRIRRHDGHYHWFLVRAWPLRDAQGGVVRWFGTNTDIQDLKQAEADLGRHVEELQATNAELERFNRVAVGRELRMIELKKQVNEFCIQAGQPPRYPIGSEQENP